MTQERGISTRQVAVNQFVTLRQSAAFTFNQGEDVEWFIYDILPKETVESLDDQALSLQLHKCLETRLILPANQTST